MMTSAKNIAIATALATILSSNGAGVVQAADTTYLTMKPLHGISFDVGTKRAVSYFLSEKGTCKLVLTLAEEPKWDDIPTFTATRFEAAIPALKATRFNSTEGKALEFACHARAESMTVKQVEQVAISSAR